MGHSEWRKKTEKLNKKKLTDGELIDRWLWLKYFSNVFYTMHWSKELVVKFCSFPTSQKQPSERAVFPFTFMEPHRPLCQVGTSRPMVALVKFPTDKDRPGNVWVWSLSKFAFFEVELFELKFHSWNNFARNQFWPLGSRSALWRILSGLLSVQLHIW